MALKKTLANLKQSSVTSVNPAIKISNWQNAVAGLHKLIRNSLRDYSDQGLITITENTVTAFEERLGAYSVQQLFLEAGPVTLVVDPVGTVIIGGQGRVDLYRRGYSSMRYLFIWKGGVVSAPGWKILSTENRRKALPYTKAALENCVDTLLNLR